MLRILKKIFKPEIIKAPVVTINGDEVKTFDTVEEATKEMENSSNKINDKTGSEKQYGNVDNNANK